MTRLVWPAILTRAAEIVNSYSIPVTLRQLHYRLVSEQLIPNTTSAYKTLSSRTAELRRTGAFPALHDRGRGIEQSPTWTSPRDAVEDAAHWYRLDRTAGQEVALWLAVEKNALAGLLSTWFDDYGVPVLPLGGYGSESIDRQVIARVRADPRPAVLIIAGDFDASGMDISRNFVAMTRCWTKVRRIGLDADQVDDLNLPVLCGKATDPRAPKFINEYADFHDRHDFGYDTDGRRYPVQVELDAVDPAMLRAWYLDALTEFWDESTYASVMAREAEQRRQLRNLAREVDR